MRRNVVFLVASFILSFSAAADGKQISSAPATHRMENQTSDNPAIDCNTSSNPLPEERHVANRDQVAPNPQSDLPGATPAVDTIPVAIDLERDLKVLGQRQSELAQCIVATDEQAPAQDLHGACSGELLLNFEMRHDGEPERDIPIGRFAGTSAFFYESGMTIDADGAPNAYHPDNTGLDDLANAGTPGRWEGLAKDADGEPIIQGPSDPFPGYYVSATALADRSKPFNDPTRYVDASKIPFVVLPGGMARQLGARPGDFATVFNQRNGKSSFAIFGDVGPYDRIGEGSMALAENLGIRSDARNGGARRGILYLVFPGSGNGRPRTIEEINGEGQRLLQTWEGFIPPVACTAQQPVRAQERIPATN
jgi:hypothetical protein